MTWRDTGYNCYNALKGYENHETRDESTRAMSLEVIRRVIRPVYEDWGAKYLWDNPSMTGYDHENKTMWYDLARKKHGDKRMRSTLKYEGIHYADGEQIEGKTTTVEIDHRIGWSRKLDNRQVANHVTVSEKIMSYEETFNKLRSFTSLDIVNNLSPPRLRGRLPVLAGP